MKVDIYDIADAVYWEVIKTLNIENECVKESKDGSETMNTEKGKELYFAIENAIQKDYDRQTAFKQRNNTKRIIEMLKEENEKISSGYYRREK